MILSVNKSQVMFFKAQIALAPNYVFSPTSCMLNHLFLASKIVRIIFLKKKKIQKIVNQAKPNWFAYMIEV